MSTHAGRRLVVAGNMKLLSAPVWRSLVAHVFILVLFTSHTCSEIPRPRGVSISKASFYVDGDVFTCLDGSATIPLERINDDYCDCPGDGSDEPGTSACPKGSFHCTNAGYRPENIPSSWVNDGICDCCDGTDEFEGTVCENNCKELGKQMRAEQEKEKKLQEEGHQIFKDYSTRGLEAIKEKQARLEQITAEKSALEEKRAVLEEQKKEAEAPEKDAKDRHQKAWDEEKDRRKAEKEKFLVDEAFKDLDSDTDGMLTVTEMQAHSCFDIDTSGDVSVDEAKEYLEDQEQVDFTTFEQKVWPNIKEIYKKPESTTPEPLTTPEPPTVPPPDTAHEDDYDDYHDYDDEDEDDEYEDHHRPLPSTADMDDAFLDQYGIPKHGDHDHDDDDDAEDVLEDKGDVMPDYDEETKQLIEVANKAREEFNEVDRQFRDMEREIKDLQSFVELDLGPNKEYFPLKGECYEFTDSQYTYKLCPFDRASQRNKHGGSETSLGTWGEWAGPEENRYAAMKYTRGQNCWNGPDRSTKVVISCGLMNELQGASEPNRCEYEFKFSTPAACSVLPEAPQPDDSHDEL